MKIFAKRKKKSSTAGEAAVQSKERSTFESDPIVEELLKKDPKEWNSKQRRMVKRYQERNLETVEGSSDVGKESSSTSSNNQMAPASQEADTNKQADPNELEKIEEDEKETKNEHDLQKSNQQGNVSVAVATNTMDDKTMVGDPKSEIISAQDEVYKLLEQLNSKMKRTLSRRLEREGVSALDDVRNEATKILASDSQPKENPNKRGNEVLETETRTSDEDESSNKKRKKESTDWSALPPEERLRREEQRRLQQEAAERRARGEDKTPGFKHPLNSERRRANRRKSKWKNKVSSPSTTPVKNDHNHSGFLHRKKSS